MTNQRLEVQRTIPARADEIFRLLCDPQGHVAIDSSGMLQSAEGQPVRASGDSFVVHMDREALNDYPELGRYDVTVVIRAFDQDREISWTVEGRIDPPLGHVYGYRLEPVAEGTLVTSYYDWSDAHPTWRDSGVLPVLSEGALRATLGILARTVVAGSWSPSSGGGRQDEPQLRDPRWAEVDAYLVASLLGDDPELDGVLTASAAAGLPPISVAPNQGKLLGLLSWAIGARRILEVGTLGGYSTIWLGRALPADGTLVTLEVDPHHAEVATANLAGVGLADRVEVRVGDALDSLAAMQGAEGPFDLVFIDADKALTADYVEHAVALARPGTLIVVDNVVRRGEILDAASDDAAVAGMRRMYDLVGRHPRLDATAVQTVGSKGWDGLAVLVVTA